jgi:hypothetical protein
MFWLLAMDMLNPQNHGFVIELKCRNPSETGAAITCGDDPNTPCVHSAFRRRAKRGLADARKVLATINARRVKYVMEHPEDDGLALSEGEQQEIEKRLGVADGSKNGTSDRLAVPYRVRQKAVVIYKIFHDEVLVDSFLIKFFLRYVPAARKVIMIQ